MVFRECALAVGVPALLALAAGCGGGGGGGSDAEFGARDLYVVDMDLEKRDGVSLNTPMTIEFSEFVQPDTVRHDTIQIRVGPRFGIQSFGEFKVDGNIVTFFPQLPTKADLSDAGFQPQSTYRVTVAGFPNVNRVKAYTGRPLIRTFVGEFGTAAVTSPDLFTTSTYRDQPPVPKVLFTNPPDVLPKSPWTAPGGAIDVPTDASIQVVMNKVPLLPSTITTNNVSLTMIERLGKAQNRPIQGTPVVVQSFDGTSLNFLPTFPLADQARYVLRIENRVTDLTGAYDVADNNVNGASRTLLRTQAESGNDPALTAFALAHPEEVDPRTFLIFTTRDEPEKNLTVFLNFDGTDADQDGGPIVDTKQTTASFNDAVPGAVAGVLTAAGGTGALGVFSPSSNTTLSTNSPNAINGAFHYAQVTIPTNVTVILTGTLPAQLLSLKSVDVSGVIGATGTNGGDGESGTYSTTAMPPKAIGGAGGPGGGAGGSSYDGTSFTVDGNNGQTAPNSGGGGGTGGGQVQAGTAYCFGGGGGGGGHQYAGQNGVSGAYPTYSSWNGPGGQGGPAGGIQPTSPGVSDGKVLHQKGVGGGGGGSGGNFNYASQNWRGGAAAGGGGGGAVLVKSAGDIVVKGSLIAKGGSGGSIPSSQLYFSGGGGGGGGGGSILLFANRNLDVSNATIDTSGGGGGLTYANPAYAGRGGSGGGGYIQLEDADGLITGAANNTKIVPDFYAGKFFPTGTAADAPSFFVTTWLNLGVFDPILEGFSNLDFTEQNFAGCTIQYELQMAREDPQNFGRADVGSISVVDGSSGDLTRASNWTVFKHPTNGIQDVTGTMNGKGYQFFRLRLSFTLKDGQTRDDPVPYVDRLRIRVRY